MWNVLIDKLGNEQQELGLFENYIYKNEKNGVNNIHSTAMALSYEESEIGSKLYNFIGNTFIAIGIIVFAIIYYIINYFQIFSKNRLVAIIILYITYCVIVLIYNYIIKKYRMRIYEKHYNDNLCYLVFYDMPVLELGVYRKNNDTYIKNTSYINLEECFITNLENRTSINIYDSKKMIIANFEIIGMNVGNKAGRTLSFFNILGSSRNGVDPCWKAYDLLKYYKKNGSKLEYVTKKYIKDIYRERF